MVTSVSIMKRLVSTSLVIIITAVVGLANFDVSQAQQITTEQRTQMCDPNNPNSTSLIQLNQRSAVFQNQ